MGVFCPHQAVVNQLLLKPQFKSLIVLIMCHSGGLGRGMAMPQQRPPISGPGDWGMPRSAGSPAVRPGHPGMGRANSGTMISRSNSLPGNTRSMLQQQLMDMGMSV